MGRVELRIAGPWKQEQIDSLCDRLANKYDKTATFNVVHDESLIGGFIAKVNGSVMDNSIKSKLEGLREILTTDN